MYVFAKRFDQSGVKVSDGQLVTDELLTQMHLTLDWCAEAVRFGHVREATQKDLDRLGIGQASPDQTSTPDDEPTAEAPAPTAAPDDEPTAEAPAPTTQQPETQTRPARTNGRR